MPDKFDCTKRCAILLPSLNPNEKFDRVIDGLRDAGFEKVKDIGGIEWYDGEREKA